MIRMSAFAILTALTLGVAAHGATTSRDQRHSSKRRHPRHPGGRRIYGFAGNDEIDGRGGSDVIFGGPGNDTLSGGGGKDYLSGEDGDDTLSTGYVEDRPVDFLSCGAGDDLVILADVPEVDRGGVRRLLDGAPSDANRCASRGNRFAMWFEDGSSLERLPTRSAAIALLLASALIGCGSSKSSREQPTGRFVYSGDPVTHSNVGALFVILADGTGPRKVTTGSVRTTEEDPNSSPDGS